ncbi:uncharacterized protein BJ171DRAFT_193758 [Polychytrium aggregatum]|uniref:uncharacterized protein n=1 Tax=Polychytrium aggregatum TaxID=110093 RepID=UPI0022FECAFD|nr:uncharacterized protein BJ171DRAFT_193758 [Polychytrium aggregatum]KAI9201988.1 hypothetical protein BJ171DRAFT_193758 [Polychytrium aggregatum]
MHHPLATIYLGRMDIGPALLQLRPNTYRSTLAQYLGFAHQVSVDPHSWSHRHGVDHWDPSMSGSDPYDSQPSKRRYRMADTDASGPGRRDRSWHGGQHAALSGNVRSESYPPRSTQSDDRFESEKTTVDPAAPAFVFKSLYAECLRLISDLPAPPNLDMDKLRSLAPAKKPTLEAPCPVPAAFVHMDVDSSAPSMDTNDVDVLMSDVPASDAAPLETATSEAKAPMDLVPEPAPASAPEPKHIKMEIDVVSAASSAPQVKTEPASPVGADSHSIASAAPAAMVGVKTEVEAVLSTKPTFSFRKIGDRESLILSWQSLPDLSSIQVPKELLVIGMAEPASRVRRDSSISRANIKQESSAGHARSAATLSKKSDLSSDRKDGSAKRKEATRDRKELVHDRRDSAYDRKDRSYDRKDRSYDRKETGHDRKDPAVKSEITSPRLHSSHHQHHHADDRPSVLGGAREVKHETQTTSRSSGSKKHRDDPGATESSKLKLTAKMTPASAAASDGPSRTSARSDTPQRQQGLLDPSVKQPSGSRPSHGASESHARSSLSAAKDAPGASVKTEGHRLDSSDKHDRDHASSTRPRRRSGSAIPTISTRPTASSDRSASNVTDEQGGSIRSPTSQTSGAAAASSAVSLAGRIASPVGDSKTPIKRMTLSEYQKAQPTPPSGSGADGAVMSPKPRSEPKHINTAAPATPAARNINTTSNTTSASANNTNSSSAGRELNKDERSRQFRRLFRAHKEMCKQIEVCDNSKSSCIHSFASILFLLHAWQVEIDNLRTTRSLDLAHYVIETWPKEKGYMRKRIQVLRQPIPELAMFGDRIVDLIQYELGCAFPSDLGDRDMTRKFEALKMSIEQKEAVDISTVTKHFPKVTSLAIGTDLQYALSLYRECIDEYRLRHHIAFNFISF